MKESLLPTLGAFICWGLWTFLPRITTQYIPAQSAIVYQVIGEIIVAFFVWFNLNYQLDIDPKGITLAVLTGIFGFVGILFYMIAISRGGKLSMVATISALYPLIAIALGVLFLGESLSLKQSIGICFGLLAMVLIAT